MTEVSFHFNVPDRSGYACRLVRKAVRAGRSVVLTGPAEAIEEMDLALWKFEETEFLPHLVLNNDKPVASRLARTRVWLSEDASRPGCHEVLINLGREPAPGFESFERLVEIVSGDADDRQAARLRWKHYKDRGYAIVQHDLLTPEGSR